MITIPDMKKLPDNCHVCPFAFWDIDLHEYWCPYNNCTVDSYNNGDKIRLGDCPLIEREG